MEGLGTVVCDKEAGKRQIPLSPSGDVPVDFTVWRSSKAVFGAVKLKAEMVDKQPDRERHGVFQAIQVKTSTDAKSALPDKR